MEREISQNTCFDTARYINHAMGRNKNFNLNNKIKELVDAFKGTGAYERWYNSSSDRGKITQFNNFIGARHTIAHHRTQDHQISWYDIENSLIGVGDFIIREICTILTHQHSI